MSKTVNLEDVIIKVKRHAELNGIAEVYELVQTLQSLPSESKEGWISVEERLPGKMIQVLCINKQGYLKVGGFWEKEQYFSGDDAYNNITHWQPLPSPPTK